MSLIYDHSPSGLVVARQGAGEAEIRRALKAMDGRLMLDYAIDQQWGRQVWQVLHRVSADLPPTVICRWRDERTGEPLPLSHGLVDQARRLHLDSRAPRVDTEAENNRIRERIREDAAAELAEYAKELVPRLKGTKGYLLPRGLHRRNRQFPNLTDIR